MMFAIEHGHAHFFHHATGERTARHGFQNAFFNSGDVVLRDGAADHRIDKFKLFRRFDPQMYFGKLSVTAGLFFVAVCGFAFCIDCFTVRDLRRIQLHIHFGNGFQVADCVHQVLFAHALEQRFMGFIATLQLDRGITFRQFLDALHDLIFVTAADGADGVGDDRVRVDLPAHGVIVGQGFAQRIAGLGGFQFGDPADAAGADLIHRDLVLAVQQDQLTEVFFVLSVQIENILIGLDGAGQDAEVCHLADKGVQRTLEHERSGIAIFLRFHHGAVGGGADPFQRVRHEIGQTVHHLADADIFRGAGGKDGNQIACKDGVVQPFGDFFFRETFAAQIAFHQFFIGFRHGIQQLFFVLGDHVFQVVRDLVFRGGQHADDTGEIFFFPHRQGHGHADSLAVGFLQLIEYTEEIGLGTVKTVHDHQFRDLEFFGIAPCTGGTDFDPGIPIQHDRGKTAGPESGDDFPHELAVTGGIREEEMISFPGAVEISGINTGALFLFIGGKVGDTRSCVNRTEPLHCPCLK